MKILSARQLHEADTQTLNTQGITLPDLIARAALAFTNLFISLFPKPRQVLLFCGPGNNGADALAIAGLLFQKGYHVEVYVLQTKGQPKPEVPTDKQSRFLPISYISHIRDFPILAKGQVVVDGLFGTGLKKPIQGLAAELIQYINHSMATVVAIDLPSGLLADEPFSGTDIIQAQYTITFECPKLAFFLPQSEPYVGQWLVAPIGLDSQYLATAESDYHVITSKKIAGKLQPRSQFAHKGQFGAALLLAGSHGMMGAALLAAKACLRSGVGKLRVYVPASGNVIMQVSVPEAMTLNDPNAEYISQLPKLEMFSAIGAGPGMGREPATAAVLEQLMKKAEVPLVLDADAITLIATTPGLKELLPANCILTPHVKEFERLAGPSNNDFERLKKLRNFCQEHRCFVVLKGAYSCTCTPTGKCYFNTTGNPGMATGGSGDVLTGIILALLAQGYSAHEAAVMGVYLHGLAGDFARDQVGTHALLATDIVLNLGEAFVELEQQRNRCSN